MSFRLLRLLLPCVHLVALLTLSSVVACADSHQQVACRVPSISPFFSPELPYRQFDNSQAQTTMEEKAPTVDMASPSDGRFRSLRILCFGDSLTAGYSSYGYSHYPYAAQIRKELKKAFPAAEAQVVVSGLSGDRVVEGQFLQRMKGLCATDDHPPYDWIIVLGGTNDLGWSEPPHKVFQGLKDVWAVALETGANVMALSVLEAEHTGGDLIRRRNALNEMIAQHSQHRWHYMDLCAAIPYFNMSDAQKPRIWDDGLHLTMAGYEMMGEAIAAKLVELLHAVDQPINHGK